MNSLLSSIITGVSINLVTALIIWIMIERSSNKKSEKDRKQDNRRIVKSELLSQYPNVINTNLKMQYLAFKIANLRNVEEINYKITAHEIINDLRHISNTQWTLNDLLVNLGAEKELLDPFIQFSNILARIAVSLYRNEDCISDTFTSYHAFFKEVEQNPVINWVNSSHLDRIKLILNNLQLDCKNFDRKNENMKLEILINIGESLGHLTCLYNSGILYSFENELKKINEFTE